MATAKETPPTIITLTLPTPEGGGIAPERATATLLIQRGDLAHVRQFHYAGMLDDLFNAVREATTSLGLLEDNPPVIPDLPEEKPKSPPKRKSKAGQKDGSHQDVLDDEPTIEIPLKKGTKAVKISHLKIVGGESDAAAYRQATMLAGRLIDGKLWDGETPIRFDDVYATAKKMKHLTEKDLSLFTLEDFVQSGTDTSDGEPTSAEENQDEAQATLI